MRNYIVSSWNDADQYDYSGEQIGNRQSKSQRVHFNPDGSACVASYGDDNSTDKPAPKRKERSIVEKILPQQVRYDNLCNLMTELESQQGSMDAEDYYQYHAILKAKIARQWILLSKAAGWTEHLPEKAATSTPTKSTKSREIAGKITPKNDDTTVPYATLQPNQYSPSNDWKLVQEKLKGYLKSDFTRLFGSASIALVAYVVLNTYFF